MFQKSILTGDYEFFWSGDPAFDTDADTFDHERWSETGDKKFLPTKPGTTPMRFVLRRLTETERDEVKDLASLDPMPQNKLAHLVVGGALRKIANGLTDGSDYEPARVRVGGVSVVEDACWAQLCQQDGLAQELFVHVQRKEFGDPK